MEEIRDIIHCAGILEAELIAMREKCEKMRNEIGALTQKVRKIETNDSELQKYKKAESKGLLIMLPMKLGSMTYQVVPDQSDPSGKTYKYTQHVFALEDINDVGVTIFSSDTEAMVVMHEMNIKASGK